MSKVSRTPEVSKAEGKVSRVGAPGPQPQSRLRDDVRRMDFQQGTEHLRPVAANNPAGETPVAGVNAKPKVPRISVQPTERVAPSATGKEPDQEVTPSKVLGELERKAEALDWGRFEATKKAIGDAKKLAGNARNVYDIIDVLASSHSAMSPAKKVENLGRLFDATRAMLPGIGSLSGFLDYYGQAIERIGEALGVAAENVRKADEAGGIIVHGGTWPGGHDMAFFMNKLLKTSSGVDVPDVVVSWTKDNLSGLQLATGESPPITKKSTLGVDWLAEDKVDRKGLKNYYFTHRSEIKQFLYGDCVLDL